MLAHSLAIKLGGFENAYITQEDKILRNYHLHGNILLFAWLFFFFFFFFFLAVQKNNYMLQTYRL